VYTVKEKGGNLIGNHTPFLWFKNPYRKTLKIMPRTSTKLYVHEFGFCTVLPLMIFGIYERLHRSDISKKLLTYSKSH
jgi:hypothetical protein